MESSVLIPNHLQAAAKSAVELYPRRTALVGQATDHIFSTAQSQTHCALRHKPHS